MDVSDCCDVMCGGTGAVAVTPVGGVIRMCCSVGGQWYAIRGLWKAGSGCTGFTGGEVPSPQNFW